MLAGAMRTWILGLVLVLVACGAPPVPVPPVPSRGGPAWTELTSAHFTMWTDASPGRGRELLRQLEHLRQVVLGVAFPRAPAEGKSLVIAFRNAEEVGAYVPAQFTAYAWSGRGGIFQPLIVLNADPDVTDTRIVTHELAHIISYAVIPDQPRWFAEGLAGFFETVRLDASSKLVDVGAPLDHVVRRIQEQGLTPMAAVFACTEPACMGDRYYATTWALFSYLVNVHPAALLRYQARLAELAAGAQAGAWSEVFPELTAAQLDHAVAEWFLHGSHRIWHFEVALREPPISERPIGDAEVHAARGVLRHYFDRDGAAEPPEIAAALRADPTNLLAHLVRAMRTRSADPDEARTLIAAHPEDWRAWWILGFALQQGEAARIARDRVCALAPNRAWLPRGMCPAL